MVDSVVEAFSMLINIFAYLSGSIIESDLFTHPLDQNCMFIL